MFDRYYSNRTEYVPYEKEVTINEHRAPTDASIKLYNEMLDKARSSLFDKFTMQSLTMGEIQVHVHRDHLKFGEYIIYYRFLLNDTKVEGKIDLPSSYDIESRQEIIDKVIEGVGKKVADVVGRTMLIQSMEYEPFREEFLRKKI